MKRRDFIHAIGVASVAALMARAIPFCPAQPPAGHKIGKAIKVTQELFEDKEMMHLIYQEALKDVPPGYECRNIEVGFCGPEYEGDPGDFPLNRLTVLFSFYSTTQIGCALTA